MMIVTTPDSRRMGGFYALTIIAPDLLEAISQALAHMVDAPMGSLFILDELEGYD